MTHDIDTLAVRAYDNALRRGKTSEVIDHWEDYRGIRAELDEFWRADEIAPSNHLPKYTEAAEELADVIISCMTELHKRGVKVSEIISNKIEFNERR